MNRAVVVALVSMMATGAVASEEDGLKRDGLALIQQFATTLKPSLKAAMQSGGPVAAVEVCATQAPLIAATLAEQSGWQLKRVSLKPRNGAAALPDPWESRVLAGFESRLAAGETPVALEAQARSEDEYRLMKGIVIDKVCLQCHGERLAPEVRQAIGKHYPEDRATGYQLGQLRGAFSVRRNL